MKNSLKSTLLSIALALPAVGLAAKGSIDNIIKPIQALVNSLVPILMTLALVYFIWGLITYIRSAGDPGKSKEGRGMMIWGVVALFVMASVWGLTTFIGDVFGIEKGDAPRSSELLPK